MVPSNHTKLPIPDEFKSTGIRFISCAEQLTEDWLDAVLRSVGRLGSAKVVKLQMSPIGNGMLGTNFRIEVQYEGESTNAPRSLVVKFPSSNATSRDTGVSQWLYQKEVRFYQEVATSVRIGVARPLYAEISADMRDFCLLLEDLTPAVGGDQINGCTVQEAEWAIDAAAALHGPYWGDPSLDQYPWLARQLRVPSLAPRYAACAPVFAKRYANDLEPAILDVVQSLASVIERYFDKQREPWTITHGDYRLDNMLFNARGGSLPVALVDWQTVQAGPGVTDVSFFLGCGLLTEVRREHERDLVQRYHRELLRYGVKDYEEERCWHDYRLYAPQGLIQAVIAASSTTRTKRGDQLFLTMARRHGFQMLDLRTLELI